MPATTAIDLLCVVYTTSNPTSSGLKWRQLRVRHGLEAMTYQNLVHAPQCFPGRRCDLDPDELVGLPIIKNQALLSILRSVVLFAVVGSQIQIGGNRLALPECHLEKSALHVVHSILQTLMASKSGASLPLRTGDHQASVFNPATSWK